MKTAFTPLQRNKEGRKNEKSYYIHTVAGNDSLYGGPCLCGSSCRPGPRRMQGKYKAGAESPVTISADITWEDMTFDYTEGEKTWNTETHQVDQADGKWTSDTKAITVTNHSNVGIMAKFNFAPEGDIEGSFTKDGTSTDKLELDTIKNLDEGSAAPSDTMNFGITGGAISENCKLGTITVYIAPNDGRQLYLHGN